MALKTQIGEDMKAALRARDAERLKAIRLLLAAIKQREIDERVELADADVVAVIDRMLKQRRESIAGQIVLHVSGAPMHRPQLMPHRGAL